MTTVFLHFRSSPGYIKRVEEHGRCGRSKWIFEFLQRRTTCILYVHNIYVHKQCALGVDAQRKQFNVWCVGVCDYHAVQHVANVSVCRHCYIINVLQNIIVPTRSNIVYS